jgi:hypothetical protein
MESKQKSIDELIGGLNDAVGDELGAGLEPAAADEAPAETAPVDEPPVVEPVVEETKPEADPAPKATKPRRGGAKEPDAKVEAKEPSKAPAPVGNGVEDEFAGMSSQTRAEAALGRRNIAARS